MSLQGGVQVVLQYPNLQDGNQQDWETNAIGPDIPVEGTSRCRGFVGLPATQSTYFCITPTSKSSLASSSIVGQELANMLINLSSAASECRTPCGGMHNLGDCHAHGVFDCIKILVPIVDSASAFSNMNIVRKWRLNDPNYKIVPVLTPNVTASSLPRPLQRFNAVHWSPNNKLAISSILGVSGLVSSQPKIFISYVRRDSDTVAEQLYDSLNKNGFEVFLDRFSLPPASDFQVKLTEELSNMGTVLVLESSNIRRSSWVQLEVNFARSHRLGLLSLKLPKGLTINGIRSLDRMIVPKNGLTPKRHVLKKQILDEVLPWIRTMHAETETRRFMYLRDVMTDALLNSGVTRQSVEADGTIIAQNRSGNDIAIYMTNLPPELKDLHSMNKYSNSHSSWVVGPASNMDWRRRDQLGWVEMLSSIQIEDEGNIEVLARRLG